MNGQLLFRCLRRNESKDSRIRTTSKQINVESNRRPPQIDADFSKPTDQKPGSENRMLQSRRKDFQGLSPTLTLTLLVVFLLALSGREGQHVWVYQRIAT